MFTSHEDTVMSPLSHRIGRAVRHQFLYDQAISRYQALQVTDPDGINHHLHYLLTAEKHLAEFEKAVREATAESVESYDDRYKTSSTPDDHATHRAAFLGLVRIHHKVDAQHDPVDRTEAWRHLKLAASVTV